MSATDFDRRINAVFCLSSQIEQLVKLVTEFHQRWHDTYSFSKITSYARNESFLKFYLLYNDVYLKLQRSIL